MSDPLADEQSARRFLQTHTLRHFAGRIPFDRTYAVCLATVPVGAGRTIDVGGVGNTVVEAVRRAAGEAAETLSQVARPGDVSKKSSMPGLLDERGTWLDGLALSGTCIEGRLLGNGKAVAVPTDLVLRRPGERQPGLPALSEGCAAGADPEAAALAALLELVERDALARWWRGGRPAKLVEQALEERQGRAPRRVTLLEIGGGLAPVVVMVSTDADGRGFTCAAAAGIDTAAARAAARRELALLELGQAAQRAKRSTDRTAASPANMGLVQADAAALIGRLASPEVSDFPADLGSKDAACNLAELVGRAEAAGIRLAAIDLTRADLEVAVVKLVSPDLEPLYLLSVSSRIRRERDCHGPPPIARKGFFPI